MFKQNKIKIIILIIFIGCNLVLADIKVLRNFSVTLKNFVRDETISLDNEGNLLVEGKIAQKFAIPNDPNHVQRVNIVFIADKEGYKQKYSLVKEDYNDTHRLSVSTLKSVAG